MVWPSGSVKKRPAPVRRLQTILLALLTQAFALSPAFAQDAPKSIDQVINESVGPITDLVAGTVFYAIPVLGVPLPLILVWLVVGAIFFTLYFRFVNLRGFGHAVELARGDYSDPHATGEVTHFQALATALSGTVGLGNIAGVAIAVTIGGPGATFWMIVAGFLGMSTKFVECTLGVKYRNENPDGTVSGGPMYYLSKGLAEHDFPRLGRVLAAFFAIMCIGGAFGGGNMFQANQAFQQILNVTGGQTSWLAGKGWLFGVVIAAVVGTVIIGGIKSIARVTEKIVPFMAIIYVIAALAIIGVNYQEIPDAFAAIVSGAFRPEGIEGGVIGVLIQGVRRAAFSNEAGIGSAAIAHSAVRTAEPVTEGIVALLEPFIDTVVICTMTALVIVITGTYAQAGTLDGVQLTSAAFGSAISWFPYLLALAVVLFALSTMISWSYYGLKAWTYLFGETRRTDLSFKIIFLAFVVIGAAMNLAPVTDFSDAMIFAMSLANLTGLYILAPVVKREVDSYFLRLGRGEIPKFRTA